MEYAPLINSVVTHGTIETAIDILRLVLIGVERNVAVLACRKLCDIRPLHGPKFLGPARPVNHQVRPGRYGPFGLRIFRPGPF